MSAFDFPFGTYTALKTRMKVISIIIDKVCNSNILLTYSRKKRKKSLKN